MNSSIQNIFHNGKYYVASYIVSNFLSMHACNHKQNLDLSRVQVLKEVENKIISSIYNAMHEVK